MLNNSGHVNSVSPAARAAGARPGGQPPAQDRDLQPTWNLIRRPPNSCYTLSSRVGVPTWPHSQATGEELALRVLSLFCHFARPHPEKGQPTPSPTSWPP